MHFLNRPPQESSQLPECWEEQWGTRGAVWDQLIRAHSQTGFSWRANTAFLGTAEQTELKAV